MQQSFRQSPSGEFDSAYSHVENVGIISAFCTPWPPLLDVEPSSDENSVVPPQSFDRSTSSSCTQAEQADKHWSNYLAKLDDQDFVRILTDFVASTPNLPDTSTSTSSSSPPAELDSRASTKARLADAAGNRRPHLKQRPRNGHPFKGCRSLRTILHEAFKADTMPPMNTRSKKSTETSESSGPTNQDFDRSEAQEQTHIRSLQYAENREEIVDRIEQRSAELAEQERKLKATLYRAQIEQQILTGARETVELRIAELQKRRAARMTNDTST